MSAAPAITEIAVGKLVLADDNLRTDVGNVDELAESIKSLGVLEPLLVREGDNLVVAGARRLEAAKKAGLKVVPAIVRSFTESERIEVMIVENLQREGLTPLEEAEGFRRLVELKLTQRQIASRVGCSQSHVQKRLSLLALPEEVRNVVDSGGINLESAQELASLKDDEAVKRIVKQVKQADSPEWANRQIGTKVKAEQERLDREKKVKAAAAKLKKAGKKVVEIKADAYGGIQGLPEGHAFVKELTYNEVDVEMAPAKHAKLACHCIGIHPRTLEEVAVCSNPSKHPNKRKSQQAAREKERAESEKKAEAIKQAAERRRAFCCSLVLGKIDKDVLIRFTHQLIVVEDGGTNGYHSNNIALQLIGLSDEEAHVLVQEAVESGELANDDAGAEELLQLWSQKSAANKHRATLAGVLARLEDGYRITYEYVNLLVESGYELTKEGAATMAEAKARLDAEREENKARSKAEAEREEEQEAFEEELEEKAEARPENEGETLEADEDDLVEQLRQAVAEAETEAAA